MTSHIGFAVDKEPPLQTKALDKAGFEQQVLQIRKEMEFGSSYQFVKGSEEPLVVGQFETLSFCKGWA